ncbi:hypothetical protein [Luteimonas sp. R10]|uniref:hypothetical protein n=1 Tax=Luteimonas sp. R10 TaxID=3108176 RepID=UPI00309108CC|nr:hypothetical protein U3649_17240 [Luteimonas sp. R10]
MATHPHPPGPRDRPDRDRRHDPPDINNPDRNPDDPSRQPSDHPGRDDGPDRDAPGVDRPPR